jgi:peptidoglycan/LPS O-acetylase OafA/YrhL
MAGTILICAPQILNRLFLLGAVMVPLKNTLQALGFSVLLLQSILLAQTGFYQILGWRWVRFIGILSYSVYIWQQIFCTDPAVFGLGHTAWWLSFPSWLIAVFLTACFSYYCLERPFFRLRANFR